MEHQDLIAMSKYLAFDAGIELPRLSNRGAALKSSDFTSRGMMFVEFRAGKEAVVQKMIVLD